VLYRQVNSRYRSEYDALMGSGLYAALVKAGCLVDHEEVGARPAAPQEAYKVIRPTGLPFVSYPYEWGFSQLKEAALTMLRIQNVALEHGMSLKDSSAYNIQFLGHRAVLIDTLSFERYADGEPWVAYRQFCQHFLAPLALMALVDIRLAKLLSVYLDGIPLDLAAGLLPWQTRLRPALALHIHAHAAAQKRLAGRPGAMPAAGGRRFSRNAFLALLESLRGAIQGLRWDSSKTAWADYPALSAHYSEAATEEKKRLVEGWLKLASPNVVWDLGANVGLYSRLAARQASTVIALDADPGATERNALEGARISDERVLPLWVDLFNPTPSLGWAGRERDSLLARGPADLVMALALVHHLAISNNVPLPALASFFSEVCSWLIIEFVPKEDLQAQTLLASRVDIFEEYDREHFEKAFRQGFEIRETAAIPDSPRRMYLMHKRT
jgi:hypothetical protein